MSTGDAQPAKRRPGRPRKVLVASEPETVPDAPPEPDAVEVSPRRILGDDRVGTPVDDPRCTGITFPDDREYRVENGVIVERVR